MKMTLDLPASLIKQVKFCAVRRGRKLKEAVADLLRMGLAAANNAQRGVKAAVVTTDKQTGLPLIRCMHSASPGEEMTPERMAEVLLAQDEEWHHAASR
jgi:hypothetical protein